MRACKAILLVGLIAALATPALAVSAPSLPGGATWVEGNNKDQGTGYIVDPDIYDEDVDGPLPNDPDLWPIFDGSGTQPFYQVPSNGRIGDEDTWGLFNLRSIAPGVAIPELNRIQNAGLPNTYSWDAQMALPAGTALVGIFHSGVDSFVDYSLATQGFTVQAEGVEFELWAVDMSLLDNNSFLVNIGFDPNDRTAVNRYEGWLSDTIVGAGGVKLLTGVSEYFEFTNSAFPNFTFEGSTTAYFDIDPDDPDGGIWNSVAGQVDFYEVPDDGERADLFFSWNLLSDPTYGWAAVSIDDGGVYVIPEPMTMLGVGLAVTSLGGYIRKRRNG